MKQFKEIREANNKMAFLKRVKERFPKIAKSRPTMDRIVQIVKPKNQINSKRYVELGKAYDSGNMKKLNDLITKFEKEDGIREGLWDNIHKKRKSGKPMRKKGEKGAPSDADFARSKTEGFSNLSVEVKAGQIAGKKVKAQKISVKAQSASHAIKLAAKKLGVDWKQLQLGKTQKS